MHCDEINAKLSAYLDHELESDILRRVEEHVNKCPECRKNMETLQSIDRCVRDVPQLRVHDRFAERVMSRVGKSGAVTKQGHFARRAVRSATGFFESLFDLIKSTRSPSTQTLDEFGDFPPGSLGRVYFKLIQ